MKFSLQAHTSREALQKSTQMDRNVLTLCLIKPNPALMKNSDAKLSLRAKKRKKRDHTKTLSKKTLLYIDANAT